MGKLLCIPCPVVTPMSDRAVARRIREIDPLCPTNISTSAATDRRARPKKALRGLIVILRSCNRSQLQLIGPRELVSIALKLLFHFEAARRVGPAGKCDFTRRRDCRVARACYNEILSSFLPEKLQDFVHSLVDIVHSERLWRREDLSWELTRGLLEHRDAGVPMIHELLDRAERESTSIGDARAIVRILYQILDVYAWPKSDEDVVRALERLLTLYRGSLAAGKAPRHAALRRGLELCVRHAIEHLDNAQLLVIVGRMCVWSLDDETPDVAVLEFGGTLEYAALAHVARLYRESLGLRIFGLLMQMLAAPSRVVSLLGNRVLQCLLDRRGNRAIFGTPKIFYEDTRFDLKVNDVVSREDKHFLRENRQILHDSLVSSMINHCAARVNLEATYCTICLVAVEVPCGFTAAALVCLAMSLQDLTLERAEIQREAAYHVHASVIAVMSLLCWIHEARVFYAYVNKIMMVRAQWAPHLNPPLRTRYSFAIHHVLWDKPELFFVDWEARYGLWKCFRLRETVANEKRRRECERSVVGDENVILHGQRK